MRSYRGMSPLTTLVSAVADLGRPGIASLDLDGIQEARGRHRSRHPVAQRVLGRIDDRVGVAYGTAPARDDHEIPLRIYRPRALPDARDDVPVVVWFHGGGWVLGNVVDYDSLCTLLAGGVGAVVVSVDYRMAPEHPAPVAAHDAVDATTWVAAHGDVLRADTSRMAVAGDSAGGNLAAVVAQVMRDAGMTNLRHQALLYPATDLTRSSASILEHAHAPILDKRAVDAFVGHYLSGDVGPREPVVSPLFGDLAGLPPTLVQTADLDPIRDDGIRYAAALEAAGVPVRLTNYLRVPHGFASFPGATPVGRQQRAELVTEVSRALHRPLG
ncbi:alpha/beta hydrolase [Phycicoccus sp. BSK3Z-2]|uniref:Alpha/beta hydrolase n=1 Tax=Phycicoccus avicenniae TaxID=2828860 RepID=A0A941D615_9MICO|nr:alpha/beta hydrolase [Phycicoccus avicenniae]MBR7742291.1 alpha/beta hydrolase [Phycicoccus avicenniae]